MKTISLSVHHVHTGYYYDDLIGCDPLIVFVSTVKPPNTDDFGTEKERHGSKKRRFWGIGSHIHPGERLIWDSELSGGEVLLGGGSTWGV